jgi:hypothetical protein
MGSSNNIKQLQPKKSRRTDDASVVCAKSLQSGTIEFGWLVSVFGPESPDIGTKSQRRPNEGLKTRSSWKAQISRVCSLTLYMGRHVCHFSNRDLVQFFNQNGMDMFLSKGCLALTCGADNQVMKENVHSLLLAVLSTTAY